MKKVVTFLIALLVVSAWAQESSWKFDGQIRHRFEWNNKDFNGDTRASSYNYLRSRLGATYFYNENLSAYFQLQDSRLWGEETSTLTDGSADNLDAHQAYIKLKNLFNLPLDVKLGRMEVIYGPQRLMGAVGWHNIGRSWDGVIFTLNTETAKVDFFNLKEVETGTVGNSLDKNVLGMYADLKLFNNYVTQVFLINDRMDDASMLNRFTLGFYAKGKQGHLHHETEFAYQLGRINYFGSNDISAFMFAINGGYAFESSIKPDLSAGIDFLSGDDDLTNDKYNVFNTLYATNHKYYGYMDYFLNIPANTFMAGLMDIHLTGTIAPAPKTSIGLTYHLFKGAKELTWTDVNGQQKSKDFGNEIDLTVKHRYDTNITFVGGASLFMPGDVFKTAYGKDTSTWFYLMTVVNLK